MAKLTSADDIKIRDMYLIDKMSSTEIAKYFDVTHRTILNHLQNLGVNRRCLSESQYNYHKKEIPNEFYDYDTMYDLYITKHYTKEKLGKMFNCAPHVIDRVLRENGISVRGVSEAKIGVQSGYEHHNWKGGVSSLNSICREYFQNNISPKIREKDGYECQLCHSKSNLHVHHIYPFSQIIDDIIKENKHLDIEIDKYKLYEIIINDKRFTDEDNLITYCRDCHLFKIHGYTRQS